VSQIAPRHLDALTGIRGLAAWGVVLYHVRLSLSGLLPEPAIAALGKGYLAVDLFFVLSGFVIWYNYAARIRDGGWVEAKLFLWRRFARVWPLHGAVLAGFAGFALLLGLSGRDTAGYPWAELPLHLLLVQNWGFLPELAWNHPAWSISTELAAYLLFPSLVAVWRWDKLPSWALLGIAGALALAIHLLFAAHGERTLGARIEQLGLWRCLAGFAMGMVLCLLWQRWQGSRHAAQSAGLACALVLALGGVLALPETMFIPAAFFTGLLALALSRGAAARLFGSKVLTYLGEISYSTYLAHFGLFIVFKLLFVDASLQLGWGQLLGFLALVLAASVLLYHGLEKPAQRWLNRHPPRWAVPVPELAE
jgi:peptidoglycan/LPS O-acetylase OafA/YrhL